MATLIQTRRDTNANWVSTDPVLAQGELAVNLTDGTLKIGDGVLIWSLLPVSSGGATGGGTDDIFYENSQTINTDYTLTAGKNAGTFGPITIADGVTVTVGDGDVWTIV